MTELHRDVTERRCFSGSGYQRVEDIVIECTQLTNELEKTDQLMKDRKDLFHKMWEEEQQRIMTEQQIFKEQVTRYQVSVYFACVMGIVQWWYLSFGHHFYFFRSFVGRLE